MRKKVTLFDRAKADLVTANTMLGNATSEDVFIDIAAYHAQQCIEKSIKFLIGIEGKTYIGDHRLSVILEDLSDAEVKEIVENIEINIDSWATTARYKLSIAASKKEVTEILKTCEKLVNIIETRIPKQQEKANIKNKFINLLNSLG
jgi:HEPN domain-containing protein